MLLIVLVEVMSRAVSVVMKVENPLRVQVNWIVLILAIEEMEPSMDCRIVKPVMCLQL